MLTAIVLAVMAGPFDTLAVMNLPARTAYWSVGIVAPGLLMTLLSVGARHLNAGRVHWTLAAVAAALVAVPPVYALYFGFEYLVAQGGPMVDPLRLLAYVAVILVIVILAANARIFLRSERRPAATETGSEGPQGHLGLSETRTPEALAPLDPPAPLLFDKLPAELGRDLICLRAQDHYVEAMTLHGSATVLMRLSDAERDLTVFDGMRVHRSWWVNLDHVLGFARTEAGGMDLTTTNGLTIPVGRSQRAALRAALDQRRTAAE